MSKSIYNNYLKSINSALINGRRRSELNKGLLSESFSNIGGAPNDQSKSLKWFNKEGDEKLFNSLKPLSSVSGVKAKYHEKPGAHPDFSYIKESNVAVNHYIVSMFIDIKKSTDLFKKYYPATVANITSTIQQAAIHTCWYFDGYVQRFHGDGLLVYFGGKNISTSNAVNYSLNAASLFSHFVKYDLKDGFNEQGVNNIYTRIGIDLGFDDDVLWYVAGMGECSEVTTCSLHTSLAYKMQMNAESNGIMVGDNIRNSANAQSDLFSHKSIQTEKGNSKYIFQIPDENFYYSQSSFNWQKHLKSIPTLTEIDGQLQFANQADDDRVANLLTTAKLINSGDAYTDRSGNIVRTPSQIKNQDHRFHLQ